MFVVYVNNFFYSTSKQYLFRNWPFIFKNAFGSTLYMLPYQADLLS